jgi:hypothetical protein
MIVVMQCQSQTRRRIIHGGCLGAIEENKKLSFTRLCSVIPKASQHLFVALFSVGVRKNVDIITA